MPLYETGAGDQVERVRTVAGSREDRRLAASSARLIDETKPASGAPRPAPLAPTEKV